MQNDAQNSRVDAPDKDVNDAFNDIFLSEDRLIKQSYEEGFKIGRTEGNLEAFHLGYHRGSELGAELGFYSSFLDCITRSQVDDKISKPINEVQLLLSSFPNFNDPEVDIINLLTDIRSRFKKICAKLKISDSPFPQVDQLSF